MIPARGRLAAELRLAGFFDRIADGAAQFGLEATGIARLHDFSEQDAADDLDAPLLLRAYHQAGEDDLPAEPELSFGSGGGLVARFRECLPVYAVLASVLGREIGVEVEAELAGLGSGRARISQRTYRLVAIGPNLDPPRHGHYESHPPDLDADALGPWRHANESRRSRFMAYLASERAQADLSASVGPTLRTRVHLDRIRARSGHERSADITMLGSTIWLDPTGGAPQRYEIPVRFDLRADRGVADGEVRVLLREGRCVLTLEAGDGTLAEIARCLVASPHLDLAFSFAEADFRRLAEGERIAARLVEAAPAAGPLRGALAAERGAAIVTGQAVP